MDNLNLQHQTTQNHREEDLDVQDLLFMTIPIHEAIVAHANNRDLGENIPILSLLHVTPLSNEDFHTILKHETIETLDLLQSLRPLEQFDDDLLWIYNRTLGI
jgi:hypothetical protein